MKHQASLTALFSLLVTAPVSAYNVVLWVNVHSLDTMSAKNDGGPSKSETYGTLAELRFQVFLTNEVEAEDGGETVFMAGPLREVLAVELVRNGEPLDPVALEVAWEAEDERVDMVSFQELPLDGEGGEHPLPPRVRLSNRLTVRRANGQPFALGEYEVWMRVKPGAIWRADGGPWQGRREDGQLWEDRGGVGVVYLEIREAVTLEDRKKQLRRQGSLLEERGAYEQALELRKQLVALDPEDLNSYSWLGYAHYQLRQYREAAVALERVMPLVRASEGYSLLHLTLAESYVALGEEEKAKEALRGYVFEKDIEAELVRLRESLERQEAERKARAGEEP
jgi:hypothetical protein